VHKLKEWGKPLYGLGWCSSAYTPCKVCPCSLRYAYQNRRNESLWRLFGGLLENSLRVTLGFIIGQSVIIQSYNPSGK